MEKRIVKELRAIREDLAVVKRHIADAEPLSPTERKLLLQSVKNERDGRLVPSSRFREELGRCDSR